MHATTLYVDSFGNIALNVTRDDLERVGVVPGSRVELDLSGSRYYAVAARTFADARAGDIILFEDSYRNMSVAISNGNAAAMLHAGWENPSASGQSDLSGGKSGPGALGSGVLRDVGGAGVRPRRLSLRVRETAVKCGAPPSAAPFSTV